MLDAMMLFGKVVARMMDPVLGWLLMVPRDLAIFIVAVLTSVILTVARRLTSNQDLMRRCQEDLARLKVLKREARQNRDKPAVRRINTTVAMINMTKMKAALWQTLASLAPIILLACWAFERLDFLPPQVNERFAVRVTFPISAVNQPAWLEVGPRQGPVELESAVVQIIRKDDNIDPLSGHPIPTNQENGLAEWRLRAVRPADDLRLTVKYQDREITHPLRVGGRIYADTILLHDQDSSPPWADCSSQVVLRQAWFLERLPGMRTFWKWWVGRMPYAAWYVSWLSFFAPWVMAYLVCTIPLAILMPKLTRVH